MTEANSAVAVVVVAVVVVVKAAVGSSKTRLKGPASLPPLMAVAVAVAGVSSASGPTSRGATARAERAPGDTQGAERAEHHAAIRRRRSSLTTYSGGFAVGGGSELLSGRTLVDKHSRAWPRERRRARKRRQQNLVRTPVGCRTIEIID